MYLFGEDWLFIPREISLEWYTRMKDGVPVDGTIYEYAGWDYHSISLARAWSRYWRGPSISFSFHLW